MERERGGVAAGSNAPPVAAERQLANAPPGSNAPAAAGGAVGDTRASSQEPVRTPARVSAQCGRVSSVATFSSSADGGSSASCGWLTRNRRNWSASTAHRLNSLQARAARRATVSPARISSSA